MDNNRKLQEKLITELGIGGISQEKQEELLSQMTEVVIQRILMESMQKLSDADREKYGELLDRGATAEEIDNFLISRIPDYEIMVEKIISDFKKEMKET